MGPWGEPELLVWRPEAVASEPPGPVGLEVKMGALVLLLLLTLLCSLVPICVLRRPGAGPEASGEPLRVPAASHAGPREGSGARRFPGGREGKSDRCSGRGGEAHSHLCSTPVQPPAKKP